MIPLSSRASRKSVHIMASVDKRPFRLRQVAWQCRSAVKPRAWWVVIPNKPLRLTKKVLLMTRQSSTCRLPRLGSQEAQETNGRSRAIRLLVRQKRLLMLKLLAEPEPRNLVRITGS